jgi:hypothetical protein
MCREMPLRKPIRMGLERKSARVPRRIRLARMQTTPVRPARAIDSDR